MDWGDLVTIIGALVSGAGAAAIVTAFARRKVTEAEAVGSLTDSALEMFNTAKADAAGARAEAAEARLEAAGARREAYEARRQTRAAREEAEHLVGYLRRVVGLIHDPTMTLERLRVLVSDTPPNSGVSSVD